MKRLYPIAALAVATMSCQSAPKPFPAPRGAAMGNGMHRLVDRAELDEEPADSPWEPNAFYPAIGARVAPVEPAARNERVASAVDASGPRPLASRNSTAGAAWVLFKVYSNTWSRADGSTCRFAPTCSGFGRQAIGQHGVLGLVMTFGRLHRNHSDEAFYESDGPRLVDSVRLHDFWFREPSSDTRREYPVIDAYLLVDEASQYALPEPPVAR